jgi:tRNA pseudouridine38-40 synthase
MRAMETTLKCTVAYCGGPFAGWQRQAGQRTVQGDIEAAMSRIANQPIAIQGAGRTDAGVHALGQVFSCVWPGQPPERLRYALNKMLAPDIRIEDMTVVPEGFNARFDATSKIYRYAMALTRAPHPWAAGFSWQVPFAVDLDLLRTLLPQIEGTHDFAGFESAGAQERRSTVRTIYSVRLVEGGLLHAPGQEGLYALEYHGNGFLYRMVRNLTGTLIEIARGRFAPEKLQQCLHSPGRPRTGSP